MNMNYLLLIVKRLDPDGLGSALCLKFGPSQVQKPGTFYKTILEQSVQYVDRTGTMRVSIQL